MDRGSLVRKLVTTLHLGVVERRQLGQPPTVEEAAAVILEELSRKGFFPRRPWSEGEWCGDGTVLEVLPDGRVRAQLQVSTALGRPAHLGELEFPDARSAALHLIASDFAEGIDGIMLVAARRA